VTRFLSALLALVSLLTVAAAQTPRAYFAFDGNTNDTSGAGVITSVVASGTPALSYTTGHNGGQAIVFSGGQSLQLVASSLLNNSNEALGLRTAAGANTSFTLSAWVLFTSSGSGQGYSTIFGNTGSGTGTLHAGLNTNSANVHFGFDGNDVNGGTYGVSNSVWYHVAFVYDTTLTGGSGTAPAQRIYINGIPEVTRWGVTDTIKQADLYLGNWGTPTDTSNDIKGRLDDVAIYNVALKPDQIQALADGVSPMSLPTAGTYSSPRLPGVFGVPGQWGIREIKNYNVSTYGYGTLVNADRIAKNFPLNAGGAVFANYLAPVINFTDVEGQGNLGYFSGETNFATNVVGTDDNNLLIVARCGIRIPTAGDYTFGFRSDDGARLRILGKQFKSSTRTANGNPADPAHNGDGFEYVAGTGDSNTLGVVTLPAGDYSLEFTYWEGSGGSAVEVYSAAGAKTSVATDGTFALIGDTASGGLQIVREPDVETTFTVNGGNSLFIHSGSPSTFTLAWSVVNSTTALSIDQGIGAVALSGSTVKPAPASTTTYTLTGTTAVASGNDVNAKSVTVYVNSAPVIQSLTASDTTVTAGSAVTLNWSVLGATSLTLQPGNINVTGLTSKVVTPTVDTTYTLQATNPSGTSQQTILIDVGTAPTITSFTASDPSPLYAREVNLTWNVSNATTLSINQGVGAISGTTGSVAVLPLGSTTYTLSATNTYGTSTANAAVTVATPIGVASPGFTVTRYNSTVAFPYAGKGYLESADALIAGTNLAGSVTVNNVANINYASGTDGEFGGSAAFPTLASGLGLNSCVLKATGTLVVNTPGTYTFVLNSDDGGRLRIDGQDVIVDDATHSANANSGRVTITKPQVSIEVVYYNDTGNGEVELAWINPAYSWQLIGVVSPASTVVLGGLRISEFVADNASTLDDEDGKASDWLEIWNSSASTINLAGYYLTNDAAVPNKWALPAWTLGPNKYLVVFASAKDRRPAQAVAGQDNPGTVAQPHLHTNFTLIKAGGYLGLYKQNGATYTLVHDYAPTYPAQREDVSYGISDAEAFVGYMETPTPGFPNAVTYIDFVGDTNFSTPRGRYSAPFNLTLSTLTAGATIRYTTDGSIPTLNYGTIYTGPIPINKTTVVRTAAFKADWRSTNVDTNSYIFVDDVVTQNAAQATSLGFPTQPINGQTFRYGMTLANVTSAAGTLQSLKDALAAAPTVVMSTNIGNLTDATTGIYTHPDKHGLFWERPCSIEMIDQTGVSAFQINCGVRIRGGASRTGGNPKHAFHLHFRGLFDGNLKYPIFGATGTNDFDQVDMRCEQNYSWASGSNTQNSLMREEWARLTQRDMGQPYSRNGYFHLYINGVYWGIYNWEERTEAAFGASYFGGDKSTFDAVKSAGSSGGYNTEMTDGNWAAWHSLYSQAVVLSSDATESGRTAKYMQMMGKNPDGTVNPAYPVLLDPENLADYLLDTFYNGSFDAPMSTFLANASNNWFATRDRIGTRGFAFFCHDMEHGMDSTGNNSYNRIGPWGDPNATGNNWNQTWTTSNYRSRLTLSNGYYSKSNPHYLHELLCFSAEYRIKFADRVQKHLFNGGALTNAAAQARVNELAAQVDPIIHAEAARWGSTSLNRNSWLNTAKATILTFMSSGGSIPSGHPALTAGDRTSILLQQLKGYQDPIGTNKALYPAVAAPTFSGAFGGIVEANHPLTITNPNGTGTLYYTKTGVDPRSIGGGVTAGDLSAATSANITLTQTCTIKARVFDTTTSTWSALTEASFIVGTVASSSNVVISEIHYHPNTAGGLEEFVELLNTSGSTVDLSSCRFSAGITFTFPTGYLLAPGARVVVIRDAAAFAAAYPSVPSSVIAGVFTGSLDNGGEELQLMSATNTVIADFTYDDVDPWPLDPDGNGPSLVLKRPYATPAPNPALGTSWRASYVVGGTPGYDDALSYSAWASTYNIASASGDEDGDGILDILEYALGTHPRSPSMGSLPVSGVAQFTVNGTPGYYLTLTYTRAVGRDDVTYFVEGTTNLAAASWLPAVQEGTSIQNQDGTETLTYRYPDPITPNDVKQFLRLRVVQLP